VETKKLQLQLIRKSCCWSCDQFSQN